MTEIPKKILVVRNDKLGDFMLCYPTFALLKRALPETEIHAMVQPYTKTMAELCEWIDVVQLDVYKTQGLMGIYQLFSLLKKQKYDAIITLFSQTHIGIAAFLSRIPYRLAPASKLAQVFYNHRLTQRRSRSEKPEYVYNRDLAEHFVESLNIPISEHAEPPFLSLQTEI